MELLSVPGMALSFQWLMDKSYTARRCIHRYVSMRGFATDKLKSAATLSLRKKAMSARRKPHKKRYLSDLPDRTAALVCYGADGCHIRCVFVSAGPQQCRNRNP